jgi:hypothetical protein
MYLVGIKNLLVRVDTKYIKGMLNNPDIQLNATINRWIAAILLFNFKLEHTPGKQHAVPDGLSRRKPAPEDPEEDDDVEEWIDRACRFAVHVMNWQRTPRTSLLETIPAAQIKIVGVPVSRMVGTNHLRVEEAKHQPPVSVFVNMIDDQIYEIPRSDKQDMQDAELDRIRAFLGDKVRPDDLSQTEFE